MCRIEAHVVEFYKICHLAEAEASDFAFDAFEARSSISGTELLGTHIMDGAQQRKFIQPYY